MRRYTSCLSGALLLLTLFSATSASAQTGGVPEVAIRAFQRGIGAGICKLNPRIYPGVARLSEPELIGRFSGYEHAEQRRLFEVMTRGCESGYREKLMSCSYNPQVCGEERPAEVVVAAPYQVQQTAAPAPIVQAPPATVPSTSPGASVINATDFQTYVVCWNERHPGTAYSPAQVMSLIQAKARAENRTLAAVFDELLASCISAPRGPLAVANAPTNVTAQGGGAQVTQDTRLATAQQANPQMQLSNRASAEAQALAAQRQAQEQVGVVQQPALPYSVIATPNHLHADPSAQIRHQLWRGARLTSFLHFAWVVGLGINDRRYDVTGDPRYSFLTGLEIGFRLPATPIRLSANPTLFHNILSDDVPEDMKALVQNDWGLRGGVKATYEAFSDSNYPISLGIGYEHQDWFPARKSQPHAAVFTVAIGPLSSWEVVKRLSIEYQAQVSPVAGSDWLHPSATVTHMILLKIMPWRTKFLNGRF